MITYNKHNQNNKTGGNKMSTLKSIINNIALRYLYLKLAVKTYKSIKNYKPDCIGIYTEKPEYTPITRALAHFLKMEAR